MPNRLIHPRKSEPQVILTRTKPCDDPPPSTLLQTLAYLISANMERSEPLSVFRRVIVWSVLLFCGASGNIKSEHASTSPLEARPVCPTLTAAVILLLPNHLQRQEPSPSPVGTPEKACRKRTTKSQLYCTPLMSPLHLLQGALKLPSSPRQQSQLYGTIPSVQNWETAQKKRQFRPEPYRIQICPTLCTAKSY